MEHARFLEAYIHFALMYTVNNMFLLLPIKDLIDEDGDPTTPFKLTTGKKPSVLHIYIFNLSMCCTEIYCTCWYKGVKHASQSAKGFP